MTIQPDQPVSAQTAYYRRLTPEQKAAQVERNRARRAARSAVEAEFDRDRANATHAAWKQANPTHSKQLRDAAEKKRYADPIKRKTALLTKIKHRAKTQGLDFNLTIDDLVIPARCPVLDLPLAFSIGEGRKALAAANSPSVDRVDNSKGYVKGNVRVISNRANILKGPATLSELEKIIAYMRGDL